jgi:hypothetical protein
LSRNCLGPWEDYFGGISEDKANLTKKRLYVKNYLIEGQMIFILKLKLSPLKTASGGSLNHRPILADMIYLPSLCFQPTQVAAENIK